MHLTSTTYTKEYVNQCSEAIKELESKLDKQGLKQDVESMDVLVSYFHDSRKECLFVVACALLKDKKIAIYVPKYPEKKLMKDIHQNWEKSEFDILDRVSYLYRINKDNHFKVYVFNDKALEMIRQKNNPTYVEEHIIMCKD